MTSGANRIRAPELHDASALVAGALWALLGGLQGCAALPLGGSPTGSPGGQPSPMGRGLHEYRVAFHCHSRLSHDSDGSFERIAKSAREVGLDAVILTDHYEPGNIVGAPTDMIDGVLFIPGVEIRGMGGSLLAFGMVREFDRSSPRAELIDRFRSEGGLVVAGHIEGIQDWNLEVDGIEVYNLHAEFEAASRWSILWRFLFLPVDSFFEGMFRYPTANLERWDRLLAEQRRLPPLVGCDAHENIRIFGPLGGTLGTYRELMRLFSNHVLATSLDAEHLIDAVRRGRLYSAFDALGDANGFSMSYGNPDLYRSRDARAILGEAVSYDPGATLEVEVPLEAHIRVLRNGEPLASVIGTRLARRLPGPGVYRTEVFREGRLWILSSPMYVE